MEAIADVSVTVSDADWLAEFTRAVVNVFHRQSLVPELIERTNADHPYDTAQVLAVPVIGANPAYHQWVISETREPSARDQRGPAQ